MWIVGQGKTGRKKTAKDKTFAGKLREEDGEGRDSQKL